MKIRKVKVISVSIITSVYDVVCREVPCHSPHSQSNTLLNSLESLLIIMSDTEDEYLSFSDDDDENDESDESNSNNAAEEQSLSESDDESVAVAVPVGPTFHSASHFRSRRYEIEHYGNSADAISNGMSNLQYRLRYQREKDDKVSLEVYRYWWSPLSKCPFHPDLLPQ